MSRTLIFLIVGLAATLVLVYINKDSGMTLGMTNDNFVQLIALLAIIAATIPRFLNGSQPLSQTARHAAFWAIIGIGLIGSYQYRGPIQDFAAKVSLGLIPSRPHSGTGEDGGITVTIGKANNGHFEVDTQITNKSISDQRVHFLIDTGASSIVLSYLDAKAIGISDGDLNFIVSTSTANGTAMAAPVTIDQLVIGGITRKNLRALVAQEGRLDQSLLGMDYLNTLASFTVKQDELLMQD